MNQTVGSDMSGKRTTRSSSRLGQRHGLDPSGILPGPSTDPDVSTNLATDSDTNPASLAPRPETKAEMATTPRSTSLSNTRGSGENSEEASIEQVGHDDLCPICQLILFRPVVTSCRHTLCESCMAQWAEISMDSQMTSLGLDVTSTSDDSSLVVLLPHEIETRCPMCRTLTTATFSSEREWDLEGRYPQTYRQRREEVLTACAGEGEGEDADGNLVEAMTLYIGNEHRMIRSETSNSGSGGDKNKHEWKFFVRPSRTDIVEEVHVFLHPTFRNSQVLLQYPPYEIRRLGWGWFTIYVNVILKAGYGWVSDQAEDAPDGGKNGKLQLSWALDFNGRGSQGRWRLKVKREKEKARQEIEDERQRASVRRLWTQQRERDPDYVP